MRAWCPRCDAVRPGQTTCPTCGTPLATLEDSTPADQQVGLPPPPEPPAPPPPRSRLRIALLAATLVVAGFAFVAGRSLARPAAPATTAAPATSTTAPEPDADARQLGWSARAGGVTVTAVEASRVATDEGETVARISFLVTGLPADQQVLALRGLRLLDSGGGAFSTVEDRQLGTEGGAPVTPSDRDPGGFILVTGPAPRLGSLARIELAGLVVVHRRDRTVQLDTSGPWPAGPPLRAIDPGPRDSVDVDRGFVIIQRVTLRLRVTSAFVGGGRAVVLVDASAGYRGVPGEFLPVSAELRADDRSCARGRRCSAGTARTPEGSCSAARPGRCRASPWPSAPASRWSRPR